MKAGTAIRKAAKSLTPFSPTPAWAVFFSTCASLRLGATRASMKSIPGHRNATRFTFAPVPDPFSGKLDGVLKRPDTDPLVIHSHTAGDCWERHGSMTHTDPRDGSDVEIPANVRMYAPLPAPPRAAIAADNPRWIGQLPPNNVSPQPFLRACFALMDRWANIGRSAAAEPCPKADGMVRWFHQKKR